ncbi:hypothetical protein [Paractinoplanes toevensis]|uniref:Uncharacterized protein n=1 Tax=Paractinoplanes toevensis TaxID=571911 RepID=A0A919T991_9ACTN|nr:hypothetical protein [Actinoplanes toevensis]GIM90220.1 hypothetical protein Ato02nite_020130 [Actinoplanes toevensis]
MLSSAAAHTPLVYDFGGFHPSYYSMTYELDHGAWVPLMAMYPPLFVTLGAATDPEAPVRTAIEGYMMGFAKRSFQTVG